MRQPRCRLLAAFAAVALCTAPLAAQQAATITGRVTSEAGVGLADVSVGVPTMGLGALTRADGNYTITVPAARATGQSVQLTARLVGYTSQTVTITLAQGAVIRQDFQLALSPLRLDETVVTGAGLSARAERLGTARATVESQMIQRSAEPNVISALASKAPNVVTTQASGEPGAGTSIRIRGTSTLSGSGEPAIIVDGVPINNAARSTGAPGGGLAASGTQTGGQLGGVVATNRAYDINPEDIESIEILKGPAATSILGASAGAGGAILITTKRGRAGETRYSLRSTLQLDRVTNTVPLQRRFGSGTLDANGVPQRTACLANPTPGCSHNNPTWGPLLPAGTPTFDHSAELFETGRLFDNTLSISGGSDRTTFYLSLGALDHDGFIVTDADSYERYTVRLNADHRLRDNLRVGGSMAYAQSSGSFVSRGNNVNGLLLGAMRTPPEFNNREYLDPVFGLHRSYRYPMPRQQDLFGTSTINRGFDNPFFVINEDPNLGEVGRVFGNVSASWEPLNWLTVNYTLGADYTNDDRTEALHVSSSGAAAGGTLTRWQFYDRIIDHNLAATASFQLLSNVGARLSLGQNLNETYFRQVFVNAQKFIAPQPYKLGNTVDRSPPTDAEIRRRLEGYFGQAEFDIADQLFLTARLRNDGASTFSTEENRAWYPGASVAWTFTRALNVSENILSHGKLRAAYGESGQEPNAYQLQDVFTGAGIADFNPGSVLFPILGGFGGLYTSNVRGNPLLKPERVGEWDVGVDLGFWRGRADLALTWYRSDAEDVIFSVNTPPSSGVSFVTLNAGEIRNTGWEVAFNMRPVQRQNMGLNLGLNWATNDNEVTNLGEIAAGVPRTVTGYSTSFTGSTTHAQVGQPVGIFRGFGFVRCGISPDQVSATLNISSACAGAPRGAVYIGANGLPVSDPTERIIGDPNPDWTAGVNAELTFRNVRLSAFVDHRQGGDVFNMTRGSLQSLGTHAATNIRDANPAPFGEIMGTAVVGPGASVPVQLGQAYFQNLGGLGTREHLMEDGTFTRLREVSIAYTFTQPWVQRTLGLSSIDARVAGRNLKTWTDYTGYDPEVHTGGAAVANRGIDWFTNPVSKAWVFSIGLNR